MNVEDVHTEFEKHWISRVRISQLWLSPLLNSNEFNSLPDFIILLEFLGLFFFTFY